MTFALEALIRGASTEIGSAACRQGKHQWASEGGRACPKDLTTECSQAVYQCATCGEWDYGAAGGPGATDCANFCKHKD